MSNLRFIGIMESLQSSAPTDLCARRIPEALGLPGPCTVERAHHMGLFNSDRKSPQPIIAKYLNYTDKAFILQKFRQSRSLQIDGMKILVLADYSIEVSKKERLFSKFGQSYTSNKSNSIWPSQPPCGSRHPMGISSPSKTHPQQRPSFDLCTLQS